jgi:hypothetical protein
LIDRSVALSSVDRRHRRPFLCALVARCRHRYRLECNRLLSRPSTYLRSSTGHRQRRCSHFSTGPLPPRASVAASVRRATAFLSQTVSALAPVSASATVGALAPLSASATVSALAPVSALATVSALAPLRALARRHCFCCGHCHRSRTDWPPLPSPLSDSDWLPLPPLPSPHWPVAPLLFPSQPWPVATASAPSTGPSPLLPTASVVTIAPAPARPRHLIPDVPAAPAAIAPHSVGFSCLIHAFVNRPAAVIARLFLLRFRSSTEPPPPELS